MTEYEYRRNKQLQADADVVTKRILTIYTGGTVGMVDSPNGRQLQCTFCSGLWQRVDCRPQGKGYRMGAARARPAEIYGLRCECMSASCVNVWLWLI